MEPSTVFKFNQNHKIEFVLFNYGFDVSNSSNEMKEKVKSLIKKFPFLLKTIKNFRDGNLFKKSLRKSIKGKKNIIKIDSSAHLLRCTIDIRGNSNSIEIAEDCVLRNVLVFIRGSHNKIVISKDVKFNRAGELWIEDENCELRGKFKMAKLKS